MQCADYREKVTFIAFGHIYPDYEALELSIPQILEEKPDFIKTGDAAIVKIIPTRPMVIEPSKKIPQLGRFAIRDMGQTVAAGVCLDVEEAK